MLICDELLAVKVYQNEDGGFCVELTDEFEYDSNTGCTTTCYNYKFLSKLVYHYLKANKNCAFLTLDTINNYLLELSCEFAAIQKNAIPIIEKQHAVVLVQRGDNVAICGIGAQELPPFEFGDVDVVFKAVDDYSIFAGLFHENEDTHAGNWYILENMTIEDAIGLTDMIIECHPSTQNWMYIKNRLNLSGDKDGVLYVRNRPDDLPEFGIVTKDAIGMLGDGVTTNYSAELDVVSSSTYKMYRYLESWAHMCRLCSSDDIHDAFDRIISGMLWSKPSDSALVIVELANGNTLFNLFCIKIPEFPASMKRFHIIGDFDNADTFRFDSLINTFGYRHTYDGKWYITSTNYNKVEDIANVLYFRRES